MAKVLVVTSGKGGVGKTTSTAAIGAGLASLGQNVVVEAKPGATKPEGGAYTSSISTSAFVPSTS